MGALDILARELREPVLQLLEESRNLSGRLDKMSPRADSEEQLLKSLRFKIKEFEALQELLTLDLDREGGHDTRLECETLFSQLHETCLPAARDRNLAFTITTPDEVMPPLYGATRWIECALAAITLNNIQQAAPKQHLSLLVRQLSGFLYIHFELRDAEDGESESSDKRTPKAKPVTPPLSLHLARWVIELGGGTLSCNNEDSGATLVQIPLSPLNRSGNSAEEEQMARFADELEQLMSIKQAT